MKLLVIILNKTEVLDYLLEGLSAAGIGGATIIESSGMAMTLSRINSSFISSSIRSMFTGDEEDNRTILSVIKNNQLDIARKVVYSTVGDLSQPNTGILFTVPLDFVEGTKKIRPITQQEISSQMANKEDAGNTDKEKENKERKGKKRSSS